jgi:cell division protein FtsW
VSTTTASEPTRLVRPRDRTDLSILLTAGALLLIGLVMGLSASSVRSAESTGSAFTGFAKQFLWAALGCLALLLGARFDYRKLRGVSYLGVPVIWFFLVLTLMPGIGVAVSGARRWLSVGPFTVQPSELAKLALVVFGADVLSRKAELLDDWRHVVVPYLGAVGATCLLVLAQPDFGTVVIIGCSALIVAYIGGANLRHLGAITFLTFTLAVPVMLAAGYRQRRLLSFLSGSQDCLNTGYQACQGLVALGSGRLFGLGLGSSRQKYLYLPNPDTDFIFAILGEETGLLGTLTVLALFAILAALGIRAARRASDQFGFILAAGVTGWITMQALLNVGAVSGVLPITGVPLPLLSFGGTSLLASLAGLGLVAGVARRGSGGASPRKRRDPAA